MVSQIEAARAQRRVYSIVGEGEDRKKLLLCREVDTNLDGAKDVMRTYTDKGEPLNELAESRALHRALGSEHARRVPVSFPALAGHSGRSAVNFHKLIP